MRANSRRGFTRSESLIKACLLQGFVCSMARLNVAIDGDIFAFGRQPSFVVAYPIMMECAPSLLQQFL